jgi:hypothetical protein
MKWMLYIVVFIALVIGVTFLIGNALPARTTISRSINLQQPPEAVFAVLADVRRWPVCRFVDLRDFAWARRSY